MNHHAVATPRRATRLGAVTARGQTTIPADIRRDAGIAPGDIVSFALENGRIIIETAQSVDTA